MPDIPHDPDDLHRSLAALEEDPLPQGVGIAEELPDRRLVENRHRRRFRLILVRKRSSPRQGIPMDAK